MSFIDFNNAEEQQSGDLIPAKTMAKVLMVIRPGGHGPEGWLKLADSGFEYLDAEFTLTSAPQAKRKFWGNMGVGGPTDGHQKAAQITRATLRAALESARGINPKDESEKARSARQVNGWDDFNELEFAVEIGIEKDKKGDYPDKNKIAKVITPDHSRYQQIMAGETILPGGAQKTEAAKAAPAAPATSNPVPAWAR